MKATQRLWRTPDGRLVSDGHADAASLAYAAGDDVTAADEAKLPDEPAAEQKATPPAANKARRPAANK